MLHCCTDCCRYGATKMRENVASCLKSFVMFRQNGDLAGTGVRAPSVREAETAGCRDVEPETAVVINCRAKVITIGSMESPGGMCGMAVANQCFCAKWGKRHFGKIKRAVEFMVG